MTTRFLDLIFRYPDGSFTFVAWIFGAESVLLLAAGAWCLLAPESYVRRMIRHAPSGAAQFWASHPGWVRFGGAVGIALGIGEITWLVFFSVAGRLY